ncbi:MAG: carbohydrate ABC transporter substrate-binding protein [Acidimicrobiia bacterium]|nr:ABC transporter substrate-binding protein [Acidimicrobiia bacterium]MBT8192687.1 ABC transporter substrate-binding protein [Acidimicrobiia bacterium]MBT8248419.1 ABC transporter substrate-binding protein [Acidimicrobiia bacterium]NNF87822.1 carbohydrate ABC transporter substrate-binding protein [Acidimicrobiia bacterium]NNL13456.1 carbohydrate ABC transporter substrate-binding protein [Acidimicrobiia bacterium]
MKRFRWAIALFAALALVAAACGGDDTSDTTADGGGTTGGDIGIVEIFGPETAVELQAIKDAVAPFTESSGIQFVITGDRSFQELNDVRIAGGNPPDIGVYAQPGKIKDLARNGEIKPFPEDFVATLTSEFDPFWLELVTVDGEVYGAPGKGDVKSLVWYDPNVFSANNYSIPTTWDEMLALIETMKADGNTPFCVGIGSGGATGWPFTDWMEDFMLRLHGPEVYDQWVNHEIPFDDPRVIEVGNFVVDLWDAEGNVFGGRETIASTDFGDSGLPLLEGKCMMHRQANFYGNFFVDPERSGANADAVFGPDGDINVFYLPTITDDFGTVVLGAGTHLVMFDDRPEVVEVMKYLASSGYAELRSQFQPGGGFLSPNRTQDLDVSFGDDEFAKTLGGILVSADPFRFDASDLMPGDIGAGEFWTAATSITAGNATVEDAFAKVEEVWKDIEG